MPPKPRAAQDARDLVRKAADLDAAHIDELYGLEPVFEPEAVAGSGDPRAYAEIQCPSCGEILGILVDLSQGDHEAIEDCQVCCTPMMVRVRVKDDTLESAVAERTD